MGVDDLLGKMIEHHQQKKQSMEQRPMRKLHPSTIGMCQRRIVFDMMMVPQAIVDPQLLRIFNNGHSMHDRYERMFDEMGILVQAEMKIETEDISGHTDALINIKSFSNPTGEHYLVELKSAMSMSFKRMKETNVPKAEHAAQLMFYMHLSQVHKGILFVECKDDQDVWEHHMEYNYNKGMALEQKAKESIQMAKERVLPPIPKGYTPSYYKCSTCQFNLYCHAGSMKNNGEVRYPNPFTPNSEAYEDVNHIISCMQAGERIPDLMQSSTNGELIREVAEKNKNFSKVDDKCS